MIIDFHTHIFPPEIRQDRNACFTSEEAFYRLYSDPKACMIGARELIDTMDEEGVDRSIWNKASRGQWYENYLKVEEWIRGGGPDAATLDEAILRLQAAGPLTTALDAVGHDLLRVEQCQPLVGQRRL